jgi:hypothetical protein
MTPPPTSIDGTDITGATIDGQEVQEITVDGQTVFTALPKTLESFESGISDYQGDTGNVTTTTGQSTNGNSSLRFDRSDGVSFVATDTASKSLTAGDNFAVDMYIPPGWSDQGGIIFFDEDPNSFFGSEYNTRLNGNGNTFDIRLNNGGNTNVLASASVSSYSTDQWLTWEVETTVSGNITVKLLNDSGNVLGQTTTNDTTHTSGGTGYQRREPNRGGSGDNLWFDNLRLIE